MNTKTCKRCGWVYPITQPGTKCLICGEPFELVACRVCGAIFEQNTTSKNLTNRCSKCAQLAHVDSMRKRIAGMHDRFDEWLAKVREVPKDYPTLTEEQWMEACRYFNGCARCDSDEIDARGFFIGRQLGGRYCDWNVIPLCTKCAAVWKLDKSAFAYAYLKGRDRYGKNKRRIGVSNDTLEFTRNIENIAKYLEVRLDRAVGSVQDNGEDATGP